ncbi:MAG TPA: hypothetical protein VEK07_08520 [Polyangiaceae bacterium]|nr:hypothetical protein [Polyangiaceae bacterium]
MTKYWHDPPTVEAPPVPRPLTAAVSHLEVVALRAGYDGAAIRTKVNSKGELVIALVLPLQREKSKPPA